MRVRWALLGAVAVFGLGIGAGRVLSQDSGGGEAPAEGPSAEEQAWQEVMTPGKEHEELMGQAGNWTVAGKMWMDPAAPPTEMEGTATLKAILGGRYLLQEYTGSFMGMPFEGRGIAGYDKAAKEFVSTWVDNMGTGMLVTHGTRDEKGRIVGRGTFTDPMGNAIAVRDVSWTEGNDVLHVEMHMQGGDHPEEFKVMELTYRRKK